MKYTKQMESKSEDAKRHMEICEFLNKLYEEKNKDYGNSYEDGFLKFGLTAPVSRLKEKSDRLVSLVSKAIVSEDDLRIYQLLLEDIQDSKDDGVGSLSKITDYLNSPEESAETFDVKFEDKVNLSFNRIENRKQILSELISKKNITPEVQGEKLKDTLLDMANYAILLVVYLEKAEKERKEKNGNQ